MSLPADDRPFDLSPVTTAELPPTPVRDRNIAASAWDEAPDTLLRLGADLEISADRTAYKRRIGDWLLWRAGPTRGPARWMALDSHDLTRQFTFFIDGNKNNEGVGPSGTNHTRFRTWKEDLLASSAATDEG